MVECYYKNDDSIDQTRFNEVDRITSINGAGQDIVKTVRFTPPVYSLRNQYSNLDIVGNDNEGAMCATGGFKITCDVLGYSGAEDASVRFWTTYNTNSTNICVKTSTSEELLQQRGVGWGAVKTSDKGTTGPPFLDSDTLGAYGLLETSPALCAAESDKKYA